METNSKLNYSVLVVDDQANNIETFVTLLKDMNVGNKIFSAPNGEIGFQIALKYIPNLILTDWDMPVMNGLEMIKKLKSENQTKDIPIIMITGVQTDPNSMRDSFIAGVHDYLSKPFNNQEFVSRVGNALKLQGLYLSEKKAKDEIEKHTQTIKKQNDKLTDLNKLKDNILSIISHDIRSPLASLESLLMLYEDETIDKAELNRFLPSIKKQLFTLKSFLNDLLFWAKSQIDDNQYKSESILLKELIDKIFELYKVRSDFKNITTVNKIESAAKIIGNKDIIFFIIRNFVDNAIKFTPIGGEITIYYETKDDYAKISVKNSGEGIRQDTIGKILSSEKIDIGVGTEGEVGTGVGLKLCKEFAEKLGGSISIESDNTSSIFAVETPLIDSKKSIH